jgi:TonB family protein
MEVDMNAKSLLSAAYDLKRSYRQNLALGFGISGAMTLALATAITISGSANEERPIAIPIQSSDGTTRIIPPVLSSAKDLVGHVKSNQTKKKLMADTFFPVPDDKAPFQVDVPNQQELSILAPDTPVGSLGANLLIDSERVADSLLPPPDTFIAFDEPPAQVTLAQPSYPDLALKAGEFGKVFLRVFVDIEGKVKAVLVEKTTNPGIGFEEEAVDAAWKTTWRPAISNGLPVAVWVSYAVEFKLK